MNKEFRALCTPAKLYFVIALISIGFALFNHFDLVFLVIKLLFALVWTFILSCLCDKGFSYLAWALVLFPYFLMLFAFFYFRIRLTESYKTEGYKEGMTNKKEGLDSSTATASKPKK